MHRSRIIAAAVAAVLASGAVGPAIADSGEHKDSQEISAVLGAKTSPAQAIAAAEQKTGGRAVKFDVEKKKEVYAYEIKTLSADKVSKVFVDLGSGQVVQVDNEGMLDRILDGKDKAKLDRLTAVPTTLSAGIATAEQQVAGGKAFEAGFDNEKGTLLLKVAVTKDNAVHHITIDAATGKVTTATAGDEEDDD
jgi:uncharacterized membrane protein YkoI